MLSPVLPTYPITCPAVTVAPAVTAVCVMWAYRVDRPAPLSKPNKGYHFKEWEVISGGVTIKNNKFIMPSANVEVKAIFEEDVPALQYKDADKTTPAPAATATPAPTATATPAPVATATPAPVATAIPQYTIPQTGDTSNPALLVVLMLVSGSAAIGIAVVGSKKKQNR